MGGKDSFHRKRLRWRLQTFAGKEAVPLHPPGKYVQPSPQVRASETNSRTYIHGRRSRTNMSYGTFLIHYLTG